MNVQDLLGAMLQNGAGPQTRGRIDHALGQGGLAGAFGGQGGDALGQILGGLLGAGAGQQGGAAPRTQGASTGGGLSDIMSAALGDRAAAPAPRAAPMELPTRDARPIDPQSTQGGGGLGDLLGAVLGGGGAGGPAQGGSAQGGSAQGGGLQDMLGAVLSGRGGAGGGGGLQDILGAVLAGSAGRGGGQAGGLQDILGAVLSGQQGAQGASRGGSGGLQDILGAVLGGGRGGSAVGAGALGMLASLAAAALGGGALGGGAPQGRASAAGLEEASTGYDTAATTLDPDALSLLCLKAMIAATKADGEVDDAEVHAVLARMGDAAADPQARAFVEAEFKRPLDIAELAAPVGDPHAAAQVYAASLFAIRVDTAAEQAFLTSLAQALRLPPDAAQRLHQMTGLAAA